MNKPAPFTQRQQEYFLRCMHSWFNVAEGGKRGGKNVLQVMAFCAALEDHPARLHLIAGVSIATARLNIIDCDGYGIMNYFSGNCRTGTYQNRDCLYIKTLLNEEKIVLVSGGGKKGDEKLIRGNTYGMAYVTEANLCTPTFLKEVFDRTLSSKDRKVFHDLNPKEEGHWYCSDILSHHEKKQKKNPRYGYNYGHFTIADNMSLSTDQLRRVLSTYDKGTLWYKRDILGAREQAEGLIYESFVDDPDAHLVDADKYLQSKSIIAIFAGGDWGNNTAANTQVVVAITRSFKEVVVFDEMYLRNNPELKDRISPEDIYDENLKVFRRVTAGRGKMTAFFDNAIDFMCVGLRNKARQERLLVDVQPCVKYEIINRIVLTCSLFAQGRLKIDRGCTHLIDAFKTAAWNPKKPDERLDDGTSNIDSLDAFEYSICSIMKQLEVGGRR